MKKILLVFLLLIFTAIGHSQKSGKVLYKIANISYDENVDMNDEEIKATYEAAMKHTFMLTFNQNKSSFVFEETMIEETNPQKKFYSKLARITDTSDDFYFDKKKGVFIEDQSDGILIEKKIETLNWEITSESKKIDSHLCYKAIYKYNYLARDQKTKTRTITAWFAPSLPYSYGPKNYNGLPGLILELQDRDTTFLASKIELSDNEIEINFPKQKTITEEEYKKVISSY